MEQTTRLVDDIMRHVAQEEAQLHADRKQLVERIINILHVKGFSLPSLPDVAMQVKSIAQNPDSSASDLANAISRDPAIAAHLIQVANSPLYRGSFPMDNLQVIIARLGMRVVANLVVSLAMRQVFHSSSQALLHRLQELWQFSTQVASLSHILAKKTAGLDSEQAMLGGLVHNIGALPIINIAAEMSELRDDPELLEGVITELQPILGQEILVAWGFPDALVDVVKNCGDCAYQHDGSPDYVDVVIVAMLQSRAADDDEISLEGVPAAEKLGINMSETLMESELDDIMDSLLGG